LTQVAVENNVLAIKDLTVTYKTFNRNVIALTNLDLAVAKSTIIAVVGESGCGKSTLGLSIIGLLQRPPAIVDGGKIIFEGNDILKMKESQLSHLRGTGISMIFQEPMSSLDPVYTVGQQLTEAIDVRESRKNGRVYGPFERASARPDAPNLTSKMVGSAISARSLKRRYNPAALEALQKVQISDPARVLDKYPHELSGGMAQRVMIACALLERPAFLIADEPTSALDVTTQAQVLFLMRQLRDEIGTSILFITHDLAVAAQIADQVIVMYAGEIVEQAGVKEIFHANLHPYTEGLLKSFSHKYKDEGTMEAISGDVPNLKNLPSGCRFHPRCKYAFERCTREHPELLTVRENHKVACHLRS
jgi:peptide/nickel transport system ATP-binding protein